MNNNIINLKKLNVKKIQKYLKLNKIVVIKKQKNKIFLSQIKSFLINIAKNNFAEYHQIKLGSPNHFRVNFDDKRSIVNGFFYQFNFFPWNQDQFQIFKIFQDIFKFKNKLNGIGEKKFFNPNKNNDCTIRASFQFYPKGEGYLNKHNDPVDYHQKYLLQMVMSEKGKDFKKGGLFVEIDGKKICLDDHVSTGDLIIFKASLKHGVDKIDPNTKIKNLNFNGRWMVLFATNKLANNKKIKDSKKFS